jgi:predicted DNA-binding transcriptional regulator YafY
MRRADRLFQVIQLLRRRRGAVTAAHLAERLEVSERTVYRDIADLTASGTPIEGEAGVGYRLHPGYDLPPLMFDRDEIQALVLGARVVHRFGDAALASAGARVLAKVAAVLPKDLEAVLSRTTLFAPRGGASSAVASEAAFDVLALAREALVGRRKLRLAYRDKEGRESERVVRPLGAFLWREGWSLAAYCELRQDFRNFRLDRVISCLALDDTFTDEPGRTLVDMLARYGPAAVSLVSG